MEKVFKILLIPVRTIGKLGAWLIAPLMITVVLSVILSIFRVGVLARWETHLPLLGTELTLIGLGEMQWHLFGAMIFLTAAWTLLENRHVRVDLVYARCSRKIQLWINIIGNFILLMPFCSVLFWYSTKLTIRAFEVGEASLYDGLVDRYLIKSVLPLGFAMLLLVCFIATYKDIAELIARYRSTKDKKDAK